MTNAKIIKNFEIKINIQIINTIFWTNFLNQKLQLNEIYSRKIKIKILLHDIINNTKLFACPCYYQQIWRPPSLNELTSY